MRFNIFCFGQYLFLWTTVQFNEGHKSRTGACLAEEHLKGTCRWEKEKLNLVLKIAVGKPVSSVIAEQYVNLFALVDMI
jgi:hypothetical protein